MINSVIHGNGCNPHKKVVVTISRMKVRVSTLINFPIPFHRKAFSEVPAAVSSWLARLWTNWKCDVTPGAGQP
jgi:hypothetical protein